MVFRRPQVLVAWALAVLVVGVRPVAGQARSVGEQFEAANRAYAQARYEKAVATYRQILDDGRGGLALYHNLGNAYTRLDSTGAAVWAYQRALQLAPTDRRVQHNLEFIRLREGLPIGGLPPRGIVGVVWGWPLVVLFSLGLFLVTIGGVAGGLRADAERFVRWNDPLAWGPMSAGLFLILASFGASYLQTLDRRAVVTDREVAVRASPAEAATPDTTVPDGAMVEMQVENGSWIQVRLGNGTVGWIRRGSVREL